MSDDDIAERPDDENRQQPRSLDDLDEVVAGLETLAQALGRQIEQLTKKLAELTDEPESDPRLARWLTFRPPDAAEDKQHREETPLFTIAHFVQYYNETYVGNPGTRAVAIPDCWLDHPGLVAEIATLAYTWREAHLGKKATARDAQYWHDHWRPGFAERMATEWVHQRCRSDGHKTAGAPARPDRFTLEHREREARAAAEVGVDDPLTVPGRP
ncbi:hypothetical protein H4696_000276 [Amycolatopsis lexingtonensis]|uniref:DUF4913 domain-containing protein n=1 Tax=Amycolatopsis lexingtonensis TaxID=218822 RepID=A0ABR9HQI7_9PSEU|nr:hypothetical protein [Amycolatopsis lexingtonensis]MBE1493176.1 hypothetical protein [Amycolatopsis lexingtonensis]